MLKNDFFIFYSNCLIVNGAKRSLICDLQKNKATLIPNDLKDIVNTLESKSVADTYSLFGFENKETIDEYLEFLTQNGYGFFGSAKEKKCFPKMNMKFEKPSEITNAVIELEKLNYTLVSNLVNQLDELGCKSIHFFIHNCLTENFLFQLSDFTLLTNLESIEITSKYSPKIGNTQLERLNNRPNKILSFDFYAALENKLLKFGDNFLFQVKYRKELSLSRLSCGKVSKEYFHVNQDKVLESLSHNSCLFKKISIDVNGDIKNCPSMSKSFGNIENKSLKEALYETGFKKLWDLSKDHIEICKDCEFRHICTDCRAYLEDPKNIYSKPLKCGYNPYTNQWEEWSNNPLKKKSIEFYQMESMVLEESKPR